MGEANYKWGETGRHEKESKVKEKREILETYDEKNNRERKVGKLQPPTREGENAKLVQRWHSENAKAVHIGEVQRKESEKT